jgi:hypothetical protein
MKRMLVWGAIAVAGACGGRVDEPSQDGATSSAKAPNDEADDTGSGSTSPFDGTTKLGECPEALPASEPCDWYVTALGKCYASREDACACACPRDRNSICSSGFPGGTGSRTRVSCF